MPTDADPQPALSLRQTAVSGAAWSYGAVGLGFVIQLAYTAVMSRALEPRDFGIVASAIVATQLIGLLARMGVASAVTQRSEVTPAEFRSAHGYSISVGCAALAATALLSIPLARLLKAPESAPAIASTGLVFLAASIGAVPEAKLRRAFRFSELAALQTATTVVADLIGVVVALTTNLGFWALIIANVVQPFAFAAIVLWRSQIGRPMLSRTSSADVQRFGRRVTLISILEYVGKTTDNLAVTRWLGVTQAGFYSRAQLLVSLVPENLMGATSRFLLPVLSRLKDDPIRFRRAYLDAYSLLSLTVLVPVAMIATAAPTIVPVLLGPGWTDAIPLVALLSIGYAVGALSNFHGMAAEAMGALDRKLKVQAMAAGTTVVFVASVAITGPSTSRFALAWAAAELIRSVLYLFLVLPRLSVSAVEIMRRTLEGLGLAAICAGPTYVNCRVWSNDSLFSLASSAAFGIMLGFLASWRSKRLRLSTVTREVLRGTFAVRLAATRERS